MKKKAIYKVLIFCIALNLIATALKADDYDVIINLKGFSVPNIQDFQLLKSVDKNVIINKIEEVIVLKTYGLKDSSNINYRDLVLVDSKKVGDHYSSVSAELKNEDFNFIRFCQ